LENHDESQKQSQSGRSYCESLRNHSPLSQAPIPITDRQVPEINLIWRITMKVKTKVKAGGPGIVLQRCETFRR